VKEIIEFSEQSLEIGELNVICDQMVIFINNSGKRREDMKNARQVEDKEDE